MMISRKKWKKEYKKTINEKYRRGTSGSLSGGAVIKTIR